MMKTLTIWSPRPDAEVATKLNESITIYGLPLMTISQRVLSDVDKQAVEKAEVLIFTSRYAVKHAVAQLPRPYLQQCRRVAIGRRTAAVLSANDLAPEVTAPPPFTSESLLDDTAFQALCDKRVALVCGAGGRKHLTRQLRQTGQSVKRIECYQRYKANVSPPVMLEFLNKYAIGGVIVSSCEIADAVASALALIDTQYTSHLTFFAFSKRIRERLDRQALQPTLVAPSADQQRLNQYIINWWEGQ